MKSKALWISLGVVVLLGLFLALSYNGLVKSNEGVDAQWAQVESQYQRRLDLIPNLVNSVKGIMTQEKTVFQAIDDARTKYGSAATPDDKAAAATGVESALSRLLVVMENYPQLRSVETVQSLMAELSGTENRIAVERMRYNSNCTTHSIVNSNPYSYANPHTYTHRNSYSNPHAYPNRSRSFRRHR